MARAQIKQERREQILDGLFDAIANGAGRGGRNASITDIAEESGIARGALHYYFSSKQEMICCLMRRLGDAYIQNLDGYIRHRLTQAANTDHTPIASNSVAIDALFAFHFGGDVARIERLLSVWIDFWGRATTDQQITDVVFSVQERARQICLFVVEQTCDTQQLLASWRHLSASEQRMYAATLLCLVEGGLLQWRIAQEQQFPLDRTALRQALTQCAYAQRDALLQKLLFANPSHI